MSDNDPAGRAVSARDSGRETAVSSEPITFHHLALHVCCAPCFLESYDYLAGLDPQPGPGAGSVLTSDGIAVQFETITAIYYNPNIGPEAEYRRRRDAFITYAGDRGFEHVVLEYDPARWIEATIDDTEFGTRCRACYDLRFEVVAAWAAEQGCDALTTTLTISPWQNQEAIALSGRAAARAAGLTWLSFDLQPLFAQSQRRARELGIYRQNYCGCVYSKVEGEQRRAHR
ncbi:MAG: epoxyqueuosine reductase QueH [Actinomycetes bacterium]|jgi:predicted adenine nucleotide alpha hydrolase (AANH) superfamily ATPase|nr:epoxyqueuosine reductase QueH [Actinomycetes bacterium]